MTDRKLGRVRSRRDPRTLALSRYLGPGALPAPPPARDWSHPSSGAPTWGMWRNDELGDCTCASRAHLLQAEAANTGRSIAIADADVVGAYAAVTGYDPARPETDQGAQMIDVLRYQRSTGIAGRKIGAFASVAPANRLEVEAAINLFGGLYAGVDLPIAAQTQTVWDVAPPGRHDANYQPDSWGKHAIAVVAYSRTGLLGITWGAPKVMTWEWFMTYCSEAWASIDALWIADTGLAPSGFDAAAVAYDLATIGAAA